MLHLWTAAIFSFEVSVLQEVTLARQVRGNFNERAGRSVPFSVLWLKAGCMGRVFWHLILCAKWAISSGSGGSSDWWRYGLGGLPETSSVVTLPADFRVASLDFTFRMANRGQWTTLTQSYAPLRLFQDPGACFLAHPL